MNSCLHLLLLHFLFRLICFPQWRLVTYFSSLVLSLCIRAHSTRFTFLTPPLPPYLGALAQMCAMCTRSELSVEKSVSKSWTQTTTRISCCHCDWLSAKAHIPHLSDCTIVSPWDTPQMQVNSDPVHLKHPTNRSSFTQLQKHKGAKKPKRKPGIVVITTWASLKLSFLDKQHRHLGTCVLHILD